MSEAAELKLKNTCLAFGSLPQGLCFGFSHLCFLSPSFPAPFNRAASNPATQEERILAALGDSGDEDAGRRARGLGLCAREL